jgi:hypothetical protein
VWHPAFPDRLRNKCRKPGPAQEVPETLSEAAAAAPAAATKLRTLLGTFLLSVHRTATPLLAISS